jgi:hypothetical protein
MKAEDKKLEEQDNNDGSSDGDPEYTFDECDDRPGKHRKVF